MGSGHFPSMGTGSCLSADEEICSVMVVESSGSTGMGRGSCTCSELAAALSVGNRHCPWMGNRHKEKLLHVAVTGPPVQDWTGNGQWADTRGSKLPQPRQQGERLDTLLDCQADPARDLEPLAADLEQAWGISSAEAPRTPTTLSQITRETPFQITVFEWFGKWSQLGGENEEWSFNMDGKWMLAWRKEWYPYHGSQTLVYHFPARCHIMHLLTKCKICHTTFFHRGIDKIAPFGIYLLHHQCHYLTFHKCGYSTHRSGEQTDISAYTCTCRMTTFCEW